MFLYNLSVPSSRVFACLLKMGPIGCPKLLVTNYQSTVCNIPEESRSHLNHWGKSEIMNDSVHTVHVGIS